jgi:hypothetical protein
MKLVADNGADTVTDVEEELSAGSGSTADALLTVDVLAMVLPFKSVLTLAATIVAVPLCPLANELNVMVRFRPAPLSQTPFGDAVQETNVTKVLGRRSLIATDAALGPLLVIVML